MVYYAMCIFVAIDGTAPRGAVPSVATKINAWKSDADDTGVARINSLSVSLPAPSPGTGVPCHLKYIAGPFAP